MPVRLGEIHSRITGKRSLFPLHPQLRVNGLSASLRLANLQTGILMKQVNIFLHRQLDVNGLSASKAG